MLAIQILAWLIILYLTICATLWLIVALLWMLGSILSAFVSVFSPVLTLDDEQCPSPSWKSRNCWLALFLILTLIFAGNHFESTICALRWFARTVGLIALSWSIWFAAQRLLAKFHR